jgi:hypothetical protein
VLHRTDQRRVIAPTRSAHNSGAQLTQLPRRRRSRAAAGLVPSVHRPRALTRLEFNPQRGLGPSFTRANLMVGLSGMSLRMRGNAVEQLCQGRGLRQRCRSSQR